MMPRTLGKYRIIEEIGRGGMAVVYKAVHPVLGRYVAIKVLPPQFTFEKKFVERFRREATAASTLNHPNIVIIHDVDQEDDIHYIVMEYLEGQPLSELIKEQGSLPLSRALKIMHQISSALDYAHSLGFVHRDIKPSNIIIGPEDHATLTDFGIVRTADGTSVTKEGAPIGTPEYMSPEQCDGKQADSRSDIYSLGVVLYEMLTGQVPFTADTPLVVMYQQVNKKPMPPRRINSDLSEPVEGVVLGALAKAPGERYQTAGALAEALEAAIRGEEPPAPAEPVPDDKAVESLYMRALAAVEEKRWQEAIELLNQVLLLDEHYRDARVLLKRAEEELSDVLARARRDAEKDEAERARLRRAEELRKQAKRFIRQEQWEKAVDCLREAISLAPENREIASLLAQAEDGLQTQKEIEDLCREGTDALKVEDWDGAIERLGQVLLKRPSHVGAREKLQEAQRGRELARKYDTAQELMGVAKWQEAIKLLEVIHADEPGYKESQRLLGIAWAAMATPREPEVQEAGEIAAPVAGVPTEDLSVWHRLRRALGQPNARVLMASSALLGFVLCQFSYWLVLPRFAGSLAAILPPVTTSSTGPASNQGGVAPDLVPTFTHTATATRTATPSPTATSTTTNTPTATPTPTATALPPTPTRVATPRPPTPVPATPTAVPLQAPPGMIYMPAGETRAADGGVLTYEAHYIDDHAVTWGEYEACVRDTYCARIAEVYMLVPGEGRSYQPARIQNYMPVHRATWYDADRYCRWAGKRLPTLAEWRSACENASRWNRAMLWATGQLTLPEWVADPVVGTDERVLCLDGCYSAVGMSPFDAPGSNDALWDCLRGPDPAACSRGFRCARTVE
jgi:tetratricopeptide (TPR) repeat protein